MAGARRPSRLYVMEPDAKKGTVWQWTANTFEKRPCPSFPNSQYSQYYLRRFLECQLGCAFLFLKPLDRSQSVTKRLVGSTPESARSLKAEVSKQ